MKNSLKVINQNAKLALSKSKSLLNITNGLLSKKLNTDLAKEFHLVPYFFDAYIDEYTELGKSIYLSPNENYIISESDDNTIKLWDIKSGKCINILGINMNEISSSTITPDEKTLIIGKKLGIIEFYDIKTGKFVKTLKNDSDPIESLNVTTNGKYLISISGFDYESEKCNQEDYETLNIWNIESSMWIKSHTCHIYTKAFNEKLLVYNASYYTSENHHIETIIVRDIESGEIIDYLQGYTQVHSTKITSLAITPDGKTIVSGGGDKQDNIVLEDNIVSDGIETIKLWDIKESRYTDVLKGHTDLITSLLITSDGKTIISGSRDKTIKIWDMQSKECINTLKGHIDSVNSIAVTKDRKSIMSRSRDNTLKLWDIKSGNCIYSTYNIKGRLPITVFENEYYNACEENIDNFIRVNDTPLSCRKLTKEEMEHFNKVKDENIKKSFVKDEKDIYKNQNQIPEIEIDEDKIPF